VLSIPRRMDAVDKAPQVREAQAAPARRDWSWLLPWAFLAPALVIYVVVVVYPMAYSGYLSFFKWDGVAPTKQFVGLQNYFTLLLNDKVFWTALLNNAIWLVAALLIPTSIGLGLALLLNKGFRGSSIYRSVFYFPAIHSLAVVGLIWNWIYLPDIGLINQLLGGVGLQSVQHNWLSDPNLALYAVMVAAAWNAAGLPMLLFLAGLQTINPEILEAAQVDGAGPVRRFFWITFPLLRETTLIVLAITAINSLKVYDIIYAMTYGGPANSTQVLSTWMYFLTYNYNSVGQGTAIAVILFLLTLIFAIPYIRMMGRE
jgi:raffinose/stachyose/melibiose transport system permease protein